MKIPRLFTPEQFKDYLKEKLPLKEGSINMIKAGRWDLMNSFFEYRKQPLKKEMFVNESKEYKDLVVKTGGQCEAWQEAEKKVIFKGFKDTGYGSVKNDRVEILFKRTCCLLDYTKSGIMKSKFIETLYDLAEATNGELELKNVEL